MNQSSRTLAANAPSIAHSFFRPASQVGRSQICFNIGVRLAVVPSLLGWWEFVSLEDPETFQVRDRLM